MQGWQQISPGASIIILVACVLPAFFYRERLLGKDTSYGKRWLTGWAIKGIALPLLLWMIFNSGISDRIPPIFTFSDSPNFFERITGQITPAFSLVGPYWCGITLMWLVWVSFEKSGKESRKNFAVANRTWCLVALLPAALALLTHNLPMLIYILIFFAITLVHSRMAMLKMTPAPQYSQVMTSMKSGKYAEAEKLVIEQLEKCETDYLGWLMLAELYATHFHDIEEAERTIYELVNEPETTAAQTAVAFHKLADWHLKLYENPTAAQRCLEEICNRHPESDLSTMARLRINQIAED
jgi:hypothetical protein